MTMFKFMHGRDLATARWVGDSGTMEYVIRRVSWRRAIYYHVTFFLRGWYANCSAMIRVHGWRMGIARIWDIVKMLCGWMDENDCDWLAFTSDGSAFEL